MGAPWGDVWRRVACFATPLLPTFLRRPPRRGRSYLTVPSPLSVPLRPHIWRHSIKVQASLPSNRADPSDASDAGGNDENYSWRRREAPRERGDTVAAGRSSGRAEPSSTCRRR